DGNINISSNATIGSPANPFNIGIAARNNNGSGNIDVHATGGTIYFGGGGLSGIGNFSRASTSVAGTTTVTLDNGSVLHYVPGVGGSGGRGIVATGGAVNVVINGTIDPPDIGADLSAGAGGAQATVGTSGLVIANDIG